MKTPEQWTQKALKDTGELLANADYYRIWAKKIQDDSLRHAAEIVTSRIGSTFSMVSVRNEILNEIKP